MKRCGLILFGLSLVAWSGDSPLDRQTARADGDPVRQQGALAENAAFVDKATSSDGVKVHRTVYADVVAIDQPFVINRMGASQPEGMIFVLKSDLVPKNGTNLNFDNFKLREGKRPRPLVLRMNVGDMLEIRFENWLQSVAVPGPSPTPTQQLAGLKPFVQNTRYASIHVNGLEIVPTKVGSPDAIKSDGSWVGLNDSGLLPPRSTASTDETQSITYRLYAKDTGTFLLTSGADTTVHQLNAGLFGAVNVQPQGAEWYRSQTTHCEMDAATLEEKDLRRHEQTLGAFQPPPKLTPDQVMLEIDQEAVAPKQGEELRSLRTAAPGSRAPVVADVILGPSKRIYSKLRQPLIDYHAVFEESDRAECRTAVPGNPILSMLKVEPIEPKATPKLAESDVIREVDRLDKGLVSSFLRKTFKDAFKDSLKIELALDATVARVAYKNKLSWVVTNPGTTPLRQDAEVAAGKTYLIQELDTNGVHSLTIEGCKLKLAYSDLTAIITGPNAGSFPFSQDGPEFYTNPASPERRQPYREFTIIYHQGGNVVQAFQPWSNNNLVEMINAGMDQFGINYGFAAIGPEIVANRIGVGPMGNAQQPVGQSMKGNAPHANQSNDAVELKYEEFFLSSWCVGDPAMIVDVPANAPNQMVSNPDQESTIDLEKAKVQGKPADNPIQFDNFKDLSAVGPTRPRPTKAFYPDDPSNVYHSYMRDHTKMRILHAGPGPAHVHHLHAHQWLKSPNSPEATYLDSQLILPGAAYTLEMTYNGSGNRNQTVGDSIFHCHFYPHFAKGMWSLWRVHDTFEAGTVLDKDTGVCITGKQPNRAYPDGEIIAGTPIPALVPLPTLGMAPMPAPVKIADLSAWYDDKDPKKNGMGRRIEVIPKNWNRILGRFDRDKDGELDKVERQAWYNAIDEAVKNNKANKKKPSDPGYEFVLYALYDNPGYPFFVPGVSGHRPPHPPLDTAWKEEPVSTAKNVVKNEDDDDDDADKAKWTDDKIRKELRLEPCDAAVMADKVQYLNGGLPRHIVLGGDIVTQYTTRWDFTKDFIKSVPEVDADGKVVMDADGTPKKKHVGGLYAYYLPEKGTPVERAAMRAHATRTHPTALPENGFAGTFTLNGLPPTHGAPYADPSVTDEGNTSGAPRRYQAAVIQTDVVLNKKGWHYPQSRFMTLWEDVVPTVKNERAPEPFFIRTATNDATVLWHTNLVPNYYEVDDFQVRTPTDVIGQHIHLVKFDVTSSDGGANGFNYEDGTFGPTEVRDRIAAITNVGGLFGFDPRTGYVDKNVQKDVAVWPNMYAYPNPSNPNDPNGLFGKPPAHQNWEGAMTTIQRWAIDPLLNWQGHDRTLRTVFTHDHFGPSTHQQVGLYAGVLVEPQGSQWYLPDGTPMYTRTDGGPTSWQAVIETANPKATHREYAIEFQDMHLAYTADSKVPPEGSNALFKPKLLSAEANQKIKDIFKNYKIENYNGATSQAPSAFFIGQLQESVPFVIRLLQTTHDGDSVPDQFLANKYFQNYGIPLDKNTKVYNLATGNPLQGSLGAQWLFVVPPGTDAKGALVLNGGDYYILEANNPKVQQTVGNIVGQATSPQSLSVYTPNIPPGFSDPAHAVNPNPGDGGNLGTPRGPAQTATISNSNFGNGAPYTSLVSTRANGTYSMNYRNEPVQLRVDPNNPDKPVLPNQTDLAFAFSSAIDRGHQYLNEQPKGNDAISLGSLYKFPPPLIPPGVPGPQGTDPFTPLIRGYVGDDIQIRTLVGAHLQPHAFTIHGVDWLSQPSYHDSGYRNVQSMGISEHYEMRFKMPSAAASRPGMPSGADYFYSASTGAVGLSNGLWGIMRSYANKVKGLEPLNNNPEPESVKPINFKQQFVDAKAGGRATTEFTVVATTAAKALPQGKLIYNQGADNAKNAFSDPNAVLFVRESDLDSGKLKSGVRVEPLILRAAAGDWIKLTLKNDLPNDTTSTPFDQSFSFRYGNPFNELPRLPGDKPNDPPAATVGEVPMKISQQVGLHPQLVAYDVTESNGINVGFNPTGTVGPGQSRDYYWYAGELVQKVGKPIETPVEFGATNLVAADLMLQTQFGMVGALIIEPVGTVWKEDTLTPSSHASGTVTKDNKPLFRECVLVMQNMVKNLSPGREDSANQIGGRDAGFGAVNYRTENFDTRGPRPPEPADLGFARVFSNALRPPETPIFEAKAGTAVRFRVVMPSTTAANSAAQPVVFSLHGHGWQDEPYAERSTQIGHNDMAQFVGSQEVTVTQKYDIVLDSAGGPFQVPGYYLYQAYNQEQRMGIWGLFKVNK